MRTKLLIITALLAVTAIVYLATSWLSNNKKKKQNSVEAIMAIIQEKRMEIALNALDEKLKPLIPVGEENFKKIVAYIELYGSKEKGCTLFTFTDKNGNYHKMVIMTNENDADDELSAQDSVSQVTVLMYYDQIIDQEHTLIYAITKNKAVLVLQKQASDEKNVKAVKEGYEDFLLFTDQD